MTMRIPVVGTIILCESFHLDRVKSIMLTFSIENNVRKSFGRKMVRSLKRPASITFIHILQPRYYCQLYKNAKIQVSKQLKESIVILKHSSRSPNSPFTLFNRKGIRASPGNPTRRGRTSNYTGMWRTTNGYSP